MELTLSSATSALLPGLLLLHLLRFLKPLLELALGKGLALGLLEFGLDLLGMHEPLLDYKVLSDGIKLGQQIIVTECRGYAVTDEEHHYRHEPQGHELHRRGRRIVGRRLTAHRHL